MARVGDKKLYMSDLKDLYQPNMSQDDSLKITQNFIESWARKQILLDKARFNLSGKEEDNLETMVKQYEEDLLINYYKAALVTQNIDSIVSDSDIEDFYISNNQIFNLNEDVLRYRMISFASKDKKAAKMKELFRKNDSISRAELLKGDYIFQSVQLNDSVWIKYNDFINKYEFAKDIDKNQLLKEKNVVEHKDNNLTYYIYIQSALKRGDIAPLQFIREDVIKMIIHQKKLKYLQELENKLIQEAIQNNTYEKY